MEVPGGIEPRTILPPLRTRLEDEGRGRNLNLVGVEGLEPINHSFMRRGPSPIRRHTQYSIS